MIKCGGVLQSHVIGMATRVISMVGFGKWAALALAAGLALSASQAQAQARRLIYLKNTCSRPLRLIIGHTDQRGFHQQGWYYFNPGDASYLRSNAGDKLVQIEDRPLYAYAETVDDGRRLYWQGTGPEVSMDGGIYRVMVLATRLDSDGDILARITCD
jgi:uncharacterized membrane protein